MEGVFDCALGGGGWGLISRVLFVGVGNGKYESGTPNGNTRWRDGVAVFSEFCFVSVEHGSVAGGQVAGPTERWLQDVLDVERTHCLLFPGLFRWAWETSNTECIAKVLLADSWTIGAGTRMGRNHVSTYSRRRYDRHLVSLCSRWHFAENEKITRELFRMIFFFFTRGTM